SKGSAVIPEGETLTVGSGDTLTLNGTLTAATGNSQLVVHNGGTLKTTYLTAEDISPISDMAYTGTDIQPEIRFINPTILGKVFTLDTKGYTPSYANNTNVGKATVTFTKGSYAVNKDFDIVQSATEFTGGVKAYNGSTEATTFTYGETITVKVTPTATGTAPTAFAFTAPTANQMALFVGETQITDAKSANNGEQVSFTIATADKHLKIGSNTITAKYVGNANMANNEGSVTVTLNKKEITSATVATDATKVYDGTNNFTNVALTLTEVKSGDNVTATANGTTADANVGTTKAFTATATTLGGAQSGYYSLATSAVSGTVEITQATPAYEVADQSIKIGKGISAISKNDTATGVNSTAVAGTLTWALTDGGTALDETYSFSGAVDATITLYWSFAPTSGNYEDIKGSTVFTLADKDVPVLSVANISKTYDGTAVTTVSGTASVDNQPVAGTFAFAAGTAEMKNADVYTATVEFTPDNTADYTTASTAITVTITKATPSGTPSVDNITSGGKTLADANLAMGSITPAGSIAWDLVASTEVTQGTEYAWTFTPTDTANYNNLSGKLTLWAQSSGGGSSSGGGGGSGSGGGSTITPPADNKPNTPTEGEIKVNGKVDANGNVNVSITDKNVNDAYNKALAEAKKNGKEANGITLVLNVDTGNKTANSLTLNLPKTVQENIIIRKIVNTVVVVDNPNIKINMDLSTVKEINRQAKADVTITATKQDNSKLTGNAKTAIGNRPVFDLKINYGSGKQVSSFGAGSVAVEIPYALSANEKAGNVHAVYVDANGKVQWLTSSVYDSVNKVLRFSTNHFSTYGVGYKTANTSFTDITNHWAKDSIEFVVARGLFSGTSNTTFSPNTAMTRGMFVTALGRLAEADVSKYKTSSFSDVKADAYYMGYVEWATKNNIVNGIGDGKFAPDQSITREQMAVIMANYAKAIGFNLPKAHAENTFADNAKINSYAASAVKQMQMAGVISGKDGNQFDPQGTATRAEVSAVLKRFVELMIDSDTAQGWTMNDSGKWMYYENGKAVTGKQTIGGASYTFNSYGETNDTPRDLSYGTHSVVKNESWWSIAKDYKCSMFELARINNKTIFSMLYVGDVLKVPSK
ncbi:S-layer homology domain-containing protein, partial [Anaerotignum sp.]|uniref:S-layer homology domain-containing protein n=1 Tax=Anaerotignum sp. TaxID=2039241 RepID=UPI0028A901DB